MIRKTVKHVLLVTLLLVLVGAAFIYITAPQLEQLEGKCFYHNSVFNEISRGEASFLRVESHDIWRYNVQYFTAFTNETLVVGSIQKANSGTLKYNFHEAGEYTRFEVCPSVGRPLWKRKQVVFAY
ncbi:hypothetical protein [Bacteriovorax sp. Seq25_V]|uniref:hypothetical protein n=1 Tax=Bacteriovorax sp. Seq25_V TaxID=1201288 RepID=UPI00038A1938|nr:hypothetical protein [Bacteriovorax sp. Seq25_V]EQC46069.1 hypothetical protein M900_1609 [Bacteriovorax sp. Seq25_V]